jgi:hypothetical protein
MEPYRRKRASFIVTQHTAYVQRQIFPPQGKRLAHEKRSTRTVPANRLVALLQPKKLPASLDSQSASASLLPPLCKQGIRPLNSSDKMRNQCTEVCTHRNGEVHGADYIPVQLRGLVQLLGGTEDVRRKEKLGRSRRPAIS